MFWMLCSFIKVINKNQSLFWSSETLWLHLLLLLSIFNFCMLNSVVLRWSSDYLQLFLCFSFLKNMTMENLQSAEGRPAFTAAHKQEAESENPAALHTNTKREESEVYDLPHRFEDSSAEVFVASADSTNFSQFPIWPENMQLWFEQLIHGQEPVSNLRPDCDWMKSHIRENTAGVCNYKTNWFDHITHFYMWNLLYTFTIQRVLMENASLATPYLSINASMAKPESYYLPW